MGKDVLGESSAFIPLLAFPIYCTVLVEFLLITMHHGCIVISKNSTSIVET